MMKIAWKNPFATPERHTASLTLPSPRMAFTNYMEENATPMKGMNGI